MTDTAALLLSGGMDSIALAFWKRPKWAVTVDYGQRAGQAERTAAAQVCLELDIEHVVVCVDCSVLGSGDLAGKAPLDGAPASDWWPYRNQLVATIAAAALAGRSVSTLLFGTVATDSEHADGTPGFIQKLSELLALQEGGPRVEAPGIGLSSSELVRTSRIPIELLAWAHSCHVANLACGRCRGCRKHYVTMKELGHGPY